MPPPPLSLLQQKQQQHQRAPLHMQGHYPPFPAHSPPAPPPLSSLNDLSAAKSSTTTSQAMMPPDMANGSTQQQQGPDPATLAAFFAAYSHGFPPFPGPPHPAPAPRGPEQPDAAGLAYGHPSPRHYVPPSSTLQQQQQQQQCDWDLASDHLDGDNDCHINGEDDEDDDDARQFRSSASRSCTPAVRPPLPAAASTASGSLKRRRVMTGTNATANTTSGPRSSTSSSSAKPLGIASGWDLAPQFGSSISAAGRSAISEASALAAKRAELERARRVQLRGLFAQVGALLGMDESEAEASVLERAIETLEYADEAVVSLRSHVASLEEQVAMFKQGLGDEGIPWSRVLARARARKRMADAAQELAGSLHDPGDEDEDHHHHRVELQQQQQQHQPTSKSNQQQQQQQQHHSSLTGTPWTSAFTPPNLAAPRPASLRTLGASSAAKQQVPTALPTYHPTAAAVPPVFAAGPSPLQQQPSLPIRLTSPPPLPPFNPYSTFGATFGGGGYPTAALMSGLPVNLGITPPTDPAAAAAAAVMAAAAAAQQQPRPLPPRPIVFIEPHSERAAAAAMAAAAAAQQQQQQQPQSQTSPPRPIVIIESHPNGGGRRTKKKDAKPPPPDTKTRSARPNAAPASGSTSTTAGASGRGAGSAANADVTDTADAANAQPASRSVSASPEDASQPEALRRRPPGGQRSSRAKHPRRTPAFIEDSDDEGRHEHDDDAENQDPSGGGAASKRKTQSRERKRKPKGQQPEQEPEAKDMTDSHHLPHPSAPISGSATAAPPSRPSGSGGGPKRTVPLSAASRTSGSNGSTVTQPSSKPADAFVHSAVATLLGGHGLASLPTSTAMTAALPTTLAATLVTSMALPPASSSGQATMAKGRKDISLDFFALGGDDDAVMGSGNSGGITTTTAAPTTTTTSAADAFSFLDDLDKHWPPGQQLLDLATDPVVGGTDPLGQDWLSQLGNLPPVAMDTWQYPGTTPGPGGAEACGMTPDDLGHLQDASNFPFGNAGAIAGTGGVLSSQRQTDHFGGGSDSRKGTATTAPLTSSASPDLDATSAGGGGQELLHVNWGDYLTECQE
ncbi:hypothetical protein BC828DRAFT_169248 [Blastocladiella britannica]|nr:hypothetical protein BC828DRAFT_169248 [Blastocladiella britannica]